MNYPTSNLCRSTYRKIQAHCAIKTSTRVGDRLRSSVGATGSIADMSESALPAMFCERDMPEAKRLLDLARYNTRRKRVGNE